VVNLLRRLFRGLHHYSKALLRGTGFSAPQVWALNLIGADPGLALRTLSQRMLAHPSTVSGVVDRLVERGVVARTVDTRDRRSVCLTLTARGRRALRRCPPPIQDALRRAVAGLPSARRRALRLALEHLARATETDRVKAPFFDLD
jgi:DNA-binding MarR family transcriptional regulator